MNNKSSSILIALNILASLLFIGTVFYFFSFKNPAVTSGDHAVAEKIIKKIKSTDGTSQVSAVNTVESIQKQYPGQKITEASVDPFTGHSWILTVNGTDLQMFIYPDEATQRQEANTLSSDGKQLGGETIGFCSGPSAHPHYWQYEEALIAYVGDNQKIVDIISMAFGSSIRPQESKPVVTPPSATNTVIQPFVSTLTTTTTPSASVTLEPISKNYHECMTAPQDRYSPIMYIRVNKAYCTFYLSVDKDHEGEASYVKLLNDCKNAGGDVVVWEPPLYKQHKTTCALTFGNPDYVFPKNYTECADEFISVAGSSQSVREMAEKILDGMGFCAVTIPSDRDQTKNDSIINLLDQKCIALGGERQPDIKGAQFCSLKFTKP